LPTTHASLRDDAAAVQRPLDATGVRCGGVQQHQAGNFVWVAHREHLGHHSAGDPVKDHRATEYDEECRCHRLVLCLHPVSEAFQERVDAWWGNEISQDRAATVEIANTT
jgi:hypothetical protein